MPFLLALIRNSAIAEKLSKERVCVRTGPAGILRRSHIVAFRRKVRVVRDARVFEHQRVPQRIEYGSLLARASAGRIRGKPVNVKHNTMER